MRNIKIIAVMIVFAFIIPQFSVVVTDIVNPYQDFRVELPYAYNLEGKLFWKETGELLTTEEEMATHQYSSLENQRDEKWTEQKNRRDLIFTTTSYVMAVLCLIVALLLAQQFISLGFLVATASILFLSVFGSDGGSEVLNGRAFAIFRLVFVVFTLVFIIFLARTIPTRTPNNRRMDGRRPDSRRPEGRRPEGRRPDGRRFDGRNPRIT